MKLASLISIIFFVLPLISTAQEDGLNLEIKVEGIGKFPDSSQNPAQARALAKRAAQLDAQRNLLAKIQNTMPNGGKNSTMEKQLQGFIAAVRYGEPVQQDETTIKIEAYLSVSAILQNYEALSSELTENYQKLEDTQKSVAEQQQKWSEINEKYTQTEQKCLQIQANAEQLQREKQQLTETIGQKNESEQRLSRENSELTTTVQTYQNNIAELQKLLQEKTQEISSTRQELEQAKQQLPQLQQTQALQRELQASEEQRKSLIERVDQLQKELASKPTGEEPKLLLKVADLEKQTIDIQRETRDLREIIKAKDQEILQMIHYKKELSSLRETLETLQSRYNEQNKALQTFEKEREAPQKRLQELQEKLKSEQNYQKLQQNLEQKWQEKYEKLIENLNSEKERYKALQQEKQQLQLYNEKMLDFLNNFLAEELKNAQEKMVRAEEKFIQGERDLQQARKSASDWEMRYNDMCQIYYNSRESEKKDKSVNLEPIEKWLEFLYKGQKALANDIKDIKNKLYQNSEEK